MFIEQIQIDGFGIFENFTVDKDKLSRGLTLFIGDNEAGKTTLMAFIRQMFFGFPKKTQTRKKRYEALRGGRFGGRIRLRKKTGEELTVIRHGKELTVQIPGKEPGGENLMPPELDASKEDIYHNIFAFSLKELQDFATLSTEAIAASFYSASMGSGGKNLIPTIQYLDKKMAEIFKSGGSKPDVNKLLKELEEIKKKLKECQRSEYEYEQFHSDLEQKKQELAEVEDHIKKVSVEKEEKKLLLKTKDDWFDLRRAKDELKELRKDEEAVEDFTVSEINKKLDETERQLKTIVGGKESYLDAKNDLPVLQGEKDTIRASVDRKLKDLGYDWSRERIMKLKTSVQIREEIRSFEKKLSELKRQIEQVKANKHSRQILFNDYSAKHDKAKQQVNELRRAIKKRTVYNLIPGYVITLFTAIMLLGGIVVSFLASYVYGIIVSVCILVLGTTIAAIRYLFERKSYHMEIDHREIEAAEAEKACSKIEIEISADNDVQDKYEKERRTEVQQWEKWLGEYGLPAEMTANGALDIIDILKDIKKDLDEIEKLQNRIELITEKTTDFKKKVEELVKLTGQTIPENLSAVEIVDRISERFEKEKKLIETIGNLEHSIEKEAGSESRLAWLNEHLPDVDKIVIESEIAEHENTIAEFETKKDSANKAVGGLNSEIKRLEELNEITDLLNQKEALISKVNDSAKKWAVYKISRTLLDQTRIQYEKERQPAIIKEAGKHFSHITEGRYTSVRKPLDGSSMYIADSDDNRKYINADLSQGTAEELYFSLRLGLISDSNKREEPLPVIMDDIFVNMDDKRLPAAIRTLRSLVETNQVLIFTCHSQTADLIKKEYPDTNIVRLHDGTIA